MFIKLLIKRRGIFYKYFRWFWERFYLIEPQKTNYELWSVVDKNTGFIITGESAVKAYYASVRLSNNTLNS